MKALGFILLLILIWLRKTLGVTQVYFELCKENHGKFLQHFEDCRKFIRCNHNQAYEFQCPGNLIWHHEIKSCDFSYRTKCEINKSLQEKTFKHAIASKFKREIYKDFLIKENSENLISLQLVNNLTKTTAQILNTTNIQKSAIDLKKVTIMPISNQNIDLIKLNLKDFSNPSTLTPNKFEKLTKKEDFKTTAACIKSNISTKINLTENNVELTAIKQKLTTISGNNDTIDLTTQQTKLTSVKRPTTEMLGMLTENFVHLTTTTTELITEQTELTETKNPIASLTKNVTENLVDFITTTVGLTTENAESSTIGLITEVTESSNASVSSTTEMSVKLKEYLVNSTAVPTYLTTDNWNKLKSSSAESITEQPKLIESTVNTVNLTTEMLVDLIENLANLSSSAESTTDNLKAVVVKLTAHQTEIYNKTNNFTDNPVVNLTTTESENVSTTTEEFTIDDLNALNLTLTTDESKLRQTTENFSQTTEISVNLTETVNLTSEISVNSMITTTDLPNDEENVSTVNFTETSISVTDNLVDTLTISENLLIHLNNSANSTSKETVTTSINTTNTNLLGVVNLILNSTDYKKLNENKAIITKDSSLVEISSNLIEDKRKYEITESNENVESPKNSIKTATKKFIQETKSEITQTETEILTEFPLTSTELIKINETNNNLTETTLNPFLLTSSDKIPNETSKSENNLTYTTSTLALDSYSTLDPRLPYRSTECQGNNNRRQFKALNCYQYYQCFAGWAFLLNCHDGWLFQEAVGECIQDVNNECEV